ncbi:hypothetical protein ROHU_024625 [Labeo rohita]|uniref:Uncharacterized protein n=1 Tax=Labeo rohita TaxID=84645 RepID=A0A498MM61_LABRO|nr:hypothetical protein ROHU_024625 [Labeo rohita]
MRQEEKRQGKKRKGEEKKREKARQGETKREERHKDFRKEESQGDDEKRYFGAMEDISSDKFHTSTKLDKRENAENRRFSLVS